MNSSTTWRWTSLVVVLAMVLSMAAATVSAQPTPARTEQQPPPPLPQVHEPEATGPGGRGARIDPMSKLDSELRALAQQGGKEETTVYILAEEGVDLANVAEVIEVRPFPAHPQGQLVVAKVQPQMLPKLASNPKVVAAEAFHPIEPPVPLLPNDEGRPSREEIRQKIQELRQAVAQSGVENPEKARELVAEILGVTPQPPRGELSTPLTGAAGAGKAGISPQDWHGKDVIGASSAWAKGFTGKGVNIAILDSGVDFGHPDLQDNFAVYENGPYKGWPIALDPRSMRRYYYYGYTAWNNYWWDEDVSWYAGVYNVIHCTGGVTATFYFDGRLYSIAPGIVSRSKSGEIRWSVHPDVQLKDYVWGNWVPFILLDATTPGVYDTVIADLNNDLWFDEYDDTAVLGTSDPILNQDLGSYVLTDTLVMTGTQYVPAQYVPGWGWGLPPTWWGALVATSPMTLTPGAWIYARNHYSGPDATDGADGVPDVSGGMVYYISDGRRPIPGMDYLYPGNPPSGRPPIPFNGQLVAFMLGSDYVAGYDHGTLCASAAVAKGRIKGYFGMMGEWLQYNPADFTNYPFPPSGDPADIMPWLRPPDEGTVQGPAPDAKIIAIGASYDVVNGMQGFYDAYTFLAYGVDGVPNSGDEFVDIVSMSYGDGSVHNDGWDWESRLVSYYNQHYLPHTTFFVSSGNGGYGFGTVNSPQGDTVVTVGASTHYGSTDTFGGGLALDQLNDGDVQPWSGRGPDAYGRPDPDVTAIGAWGTGSAPLNMGPFYANLFGSPFPGDGNNAWYMWGGTSRAAPEAAGVAALVYQAYYSRTRTLPTFQTVREILMSSARDLNHDVLIQGAGRVDADRATDVAAGRGGIYVSPSLLAAGEYQGTHYSAFANVLFPGNTWNTTFTVYNTGSTARTVSVGDEVLLQDSVLTYTVVVSPYTGMEDPTYPWAYYYYANYFVVADPTRAVITNTGGITHAVHGDSLAIPVPADADFMRVQLFVPFELFDFSYTDPNPYSVSYVRNQRWSLTVYAWEDRNGDGKLWEDGNGDGIVNPLASTLDTVDVSALGVVTQTEINRFSYSYLYGAVQEVTVQNPAARARDGIVIGITHRNANNTRPGWGPKDYQEHPLVVKVTFYKKADWTLVTENPTRLTVPAGGSATFNATFTIPSTQPPGLYEGAITVQDGTHKTIVPVTVNVAVPGNKLLFDLGGTPEAGTPYDNGRGYGAFTWYLPFEEGDWRFYFYDADTGFDQQYLYVRNTWGKMCKNMPTFFETLVWGPNPGDQFSQAEPGKYGPYGLQYAGGTWDANGPQSGWGSPRRGSWRTNADGTPLAESRAWATLWDGLNQVQFRHILASGKVPCGEAFKASVGVFGVDAPGSPGALYIESDALSGSFTLDAVSPVDGLIAYGYGFGWEKWFRNQVVPQGKHYEVWPEDLMNGWVYTFTVTNTSGIEVETFGLSWSSDIDLYLMYDANGDGLFNVYDNRERVAYSYNWGPSESISYWGDFNNGYQVQDGTYAVIMYGRAVEPGDKFDLHLATYGGEGLSVQGATPENNYVLSVTPGVSQTLRVNWQVPGPGVWNGYLWFAMPWEEEPTHWYMGPSIWVPVTINAGGADFSRSTKEVDKSVVFMTRDGAHEVLTYRITVVNDGNRDVWVDLYDLLPEGTMYYWQVVDDPTHPAYGTSYVARWWRENGQSGYIYNPYDNYIRWSGWVGPSTSGKLYIEYKLKVEHGFVGTITNKADLHIDYGYRDVLVPLYATTEVRYGVFLPLVVRNYP